MNFFLQVPCKVSPVKYSFHYLPLVSRHRWQICCLCRWYQRCTFTCEYLREFSTKILNDPNVIFGGLGVDDSWKKPEPKNLVTLLFWIRTQRAYRNKQAPSLINLATKRRSISRIGIIGVIKFAPPSKKCSKFLRFLAIVQNSSFSI